MPDVAALALNTANAVGAVPSAEQMVAHQIAASCHQAMIGDVHAGGIDAKPMEPHASILWCALPHLR